MPSRKKAKGQARKAVKAKNEAAEWARQLEERYRRIEQSQIQRLQNSNAERSVFSCMHGFDTFPNDDICIKFIEAFVREFYKCLYKCYKDDSVDQDAVVGALLKARESTKDEYVEVWNSSAKMK